MNRRRFLALGAGALAPAPQKKTVAAIVTEYRYYSHADVIVGRILEGYSPDGVKVAPRDRKSTLLNSSHSRASRMPSSA